MPNWWETFFDSDYIRLWGQFVTPDSTPAEVAGLWELLNLREGSRILDAPCGYGRLSLPLAEHGAIVLGVDQSSDLLAHAEKHRGEIPRERLHYLHHDLRQPLPQTGALSGFDTAINIFSSLGYGREEDDGAILKNLASAVRPGGLVFIETVHRDAAVARLSRNARPANRLPDGTIVIEEPELDPITGRISTCWFWSGPRGHGEKRAAIRIYSATELVRLLEGAGLQFLSAHQGCSPEPFHAAGPDMGGRLGLLAQRPAV
jgi:SAM-dependent methyltransferase